MKKYAFFHFPAVIAFVLMATFALFSASSCTMTPCPEKTCADLNLVAKTLPTQAGDSIRHSLSFANIGSSYSVEARDSITGLLLYSQPLTTSTGHSLLLPYNFRTVIWTVKVIYCDTPPRDLTCTISSKVKGGGISVVIVDRTAPGYTPLCPTFLALKTFYNDYYLPLSPNSLPASVELYKGNSAVSEATLLQNIDIAQQTTGTKLWLEVLAVTDKGCTARVDEVRAVPLLPSIQASIRITTRQNLYKVLDSVLVQTPSIGANYKSATSQQHYALRYLQYN